MPIRSPESQTLALRSETSSPAGVYKKPIAKTPPASMYSPSMKFRSPSAVEPLESRIAPAVILVGNSAASPNNKTYTEAPFAAVSSNSNFSSALGSSPNSFFLTLHAGDSVDLYNNGKGYTPFITVSKGTLVAFFNDKNSNNEVDANELTGLALGNGVAIKIFGEVNGDIATNLNADGISLNTDLGANAGGFGIKSLSVTGGSINGSIYSGGTISALKVVGSVSEVLTGTAASGHVYDFNGPDANGGQNLSFVAASGAKGADILNANIGALDLMQAGDGGVGGKGGSLSGITIVADTNGFTLQAGAGGDGDVTHTSGGVGGGLKNIYVNGAQDSTDNDSVNLHAGDGGVGFGTGKGGAGGAVANVYVGFGASANGPVASVNQLNDDVLITAGDGGNGGKAGVGGAVKNTWITTTTPDNAAPAVELQVLAGNGGSTVDCTAGAGGSVSSVKINNLDTNASTADILVAAGDAGDATGLGKGAVGGNASKITLVGFQVEVDGGNGSDAYAKAGNGGSVTSITVSNAVTGIINNGAVLVAGDGGDTSSLATNAKGGRGGDVATISVLDADFLDSNLADATYEGLVVVAGDGGMATGVGGQGGAGGNVSNLTITDTGSVNEGEFYLAAGNGGDGDKKAGIGGSASSINFSAFSADVIATAGNGGSSTSGAGGAGGGFNKDAFSVIGVVNGAYNSVSLAAGNGGNSTAAVAKSGGAGGAVKNTNILASGGLSIALSGGDVSIAAGAGGNSASGHAGNGGSIINTAGNALKGGVALTAGNAGASGVASGAGGSISNSNALGNTDIQISGGDGSFGGAGGSLSTVSFSGATNGVAPNGMVMITAGNGSAFNTEAGAGGSISAMTGYLGETGDTLITAGSSIGSATKGAVGGSINNLMILGGGGGSGSNLILVAGNASDATSSKTGAKGGSVTNVTVVGSDGTSSGVDPASVVQRIVAGNGGSGVNTGGAGGSVQNVSASYLDIGIRQGVSYGDTSMGGIFAGLGGSGGAKGLNGNVIQITANAIAAIVAGTSTTLTEDNLVNTVDKIFLNGITALVLDSNNAYTNIDTANFVGGVQSPSSNNASTFHYTDNNSSTTFDAGDTPIDGLIAAKTFTQNRNFIPGALLTVENGNLTLVDSVTV